MLVRIEEFESRVNMIVSEFVRHVETRGRNRELRELSDWLDWFERWQTVCLNNAVDYCTPHWVRRD